MYVRGPSNCGRVERAVCKPFNGPDKGQGTRVKVCERSKFTSVVVSSKNSIRRTLIVRRGVSVVRAIDCTVRPGSGRVLGIVGASDRRYVS